MRCVRVGLVLVTTLWLAATPAEAQAKSSRRTTAEALKQKGLQMVKFIDVDMDGDGRKELMVVGRDKDGLRLVLVGENPEGAVVVQVLPPAQGKEIASFVGQAMLPPATSQQVASKSMTRPRTKRSSACGSMPPTRACCVRCSPA